MLEIVEMGEICSEMAPNPRVEIVALLEGNHFRDGPNHMVDMVELREIYSDVPQPLDGNCGNLFIDRPNPRVKITSEMAHNPMVEMADMVENGGNLFKDVLNLMVGKVEVVEISS